ncbi:MAG: preprotein translocase subunit YajC [Paludibacteraceae bacterium]|jgi:preprotein translocase subunit YajC|nr:preprotein translocase subunit YajC [Paludibacteraceae bacterium]MEE1175171.1 preprotein translocase subunit YajC [Paludibacteraceae bacterium]
MFNILLQAPVAANPQQGGYSSIILIVLMIVVFYFFMIRPQMKKQKEMKKFRDSIKNGDKVITAGGIYGKVKEVKETVIVLEIADNVRISIDKGSVYPNAADSNAAQNNA